MAAALLRHALQAASEPLKSIEVVSAGVAALEGDPPSANSVRALHKVGIPLDNQRSQRLSRDLIEKSLLILVMTESHRAMIQQGIPELTTEVLLFREPMGKGVEHEIPDPFGSDLASYEASRDSMVEAIPAILEHLRKKLQETS